MSSDNLKAKHGMGYLPDLMDRRDLLYSAPLESLLALPAKVDLRATGFLAGPFDQGQLGSCVANATGLAFEYVNRKQGHDDFTPSRLFIYYNARAMEGTTDSDAGCFIRDGIKTLAEYGDCRESFWPYDIGKFTDKPTPRCYRKAANHQVIEYARVSRSLSQMKACLAGGLPFVFGISVYETFEQVASDGMVPMPQHGEKLLGGHALCCVGYDDSINRFIVRNSWGEWGDGGDCYIPYAYLLDGDLSDDFWCLRLIEG